jgi:ribosomal protein S2
MLFENKRYLINHMIKNKIYISGPGLHKDFYNFVLSVDVKGKVVLDVYKQVNQILKVNSLISRLVRERKPILFFGLNKLNLGSQDLLAVKSLNKDIFNLCFSFPGLEGLDLGRNKAYKGIQRFYEQVFFNKKLSSLSLFSNFEKYINCLIQKGALRLNGFFIDTWEGGLISNFHYLFPFINRSVGLSLKGRSLGLDKYNSLKSLSYVLGNSNNLPGAVILFSREGYNSFFKECQKLGIPVICVVSSNESLKNIDFPLFGNNKSLKTFRFYFIMLRQIINQHKI